MHRITSLATILVAVARFLFWFGSDTDPIAETSYPVVTRVYNSAKQPSRDGTFDFTVTSVAEPKPVAYVNAVIDLDDDGIINAYALEEGVQQEWIARNVPVPMDEDVLSDPRFSVWFDLSDMDIPLSATKSCAMIITEKPVSLELPRKLSEFDDWNKSTVTISNSNWGTRESAGQALTNPRQGRSSRAGKTPMSSHARSGVQAFAVPDIAQRSNECGPTSAANTLLWLSQEHQFSHLLPQNANGSVDTSQLILDLMKSMSGSIHRPYRGLKGNQMYTGLQKYAEKTGLPITISGGNGEDHARDNEVLDFVTRNIADNQGTELLVWLADGGGHWVTVTGYARAEGRAFLYVHDPDDKKTAQAVWEISVDSKGRNTGEVISPRSCTTGWGVSIRMNEPPGASGVASGTAPPAAAWLKPTLELEEAAPALSVVEERE